MENRDLLMAIAAVAVALVVIAAVLAAGYMLLSTFTGVPGPAPSPAALPAPCPTPSSHPSIPSGPFNPAGSASYPANPTPVQPLVKSAMFVDGGTDKEAYSRGDTATVYIIIKNTGTVVVDEARLDIKVERYVSFAGYVPLQNPSTTLRDLDVQPGEAKKVEYSIAIPAEYEGLSTAGKYRFTVNVYVWDTKINSDPFQKEIQVD